MRKGAVATLLYATLLFSCSIGAWAFPRYIEHAFGEGLYHPGGELRELKLKVRLTICDLSFSCSHDTHCTPHIVAYAKMDTSANYY